MTFDEMKKRVIELQNAAQQSAANLQQADTNHKMICGRLAECSEMLGWMEAQAKEALAAVAKNIHAEKAAEPANETAPEVAPEAQVEVAA